MKTWLRVALFNFFVAATFGALMRYAFVDELSWMNYRNVMHGHSHGAMLGWIYLAIYALLVHTFLPSEKKNSKFYNRLFWLTELSVIGMFISFPLEGYGGWATAFSTLHIFCSYAFAWRFFKDIKYLGKNRFSLKFIRTSLWFMVLSTFGVWSIPPIVANGLQGSAVYHAVIQFYLHFQFNGWFIFAALGLFFFLLENQKILLNGKHLKYFFRLLAVSCFLTYALAVTWSTPLPFLFALNSTGVILQLAALFFFVLIINKLGGFLKSYFSPLSRKLIMLGAACFIFKILIQSAVVIPAMAKVGYTIHNFVLGFLHLLLLGMMTNFILGLASHEKLISLKNNLTKYSLYIFLTGFFATEILLFLQGLMFWAGVGFLPYYYEVIFAASVLLPLGVGGMFIFQKKRN